MTNDKTMWTEITRAQCRRKELRYSSDTTEAEWAVIEPLLPAARRLGRPRTVNVREIVNGILFLATSGRQWRQLPKDFPSMTTVQRYFYRWRDDGTWETINHVLVAMVRENMGREASPTAGVIDSQSVKTTEAGGPRGYDAGKCIKGRKRHALTVQAAPGQGAQELDPEGGGLRPAPARSFMGEFPPRLWALPTA